MEIKISNFGDILMSRPAGREAFLMAKAYVFKDIKKEEPITLDFDGIKVLAPSWADEFVSGIKNEFTNAVLCVNTENPSVNASLQTVMETCQEM